MNEEILEDLNQITSIFKCSRSAFLRYIITEYRSYINEEIDLVAVSFVNDLRTQLENDTDETE